MGNVALVVKFLGGDTQSFLALWREAKQAQLAAPDTPPDVIPERRDDIGPPSDVDSEPGDDIEESSEDVFKLPDMTKAAAIFELRGLLKPSTATHSELLFRKPVPSSSSEMVSWLSRADVIELVTSAVDMLDSPERRGAARALFGLNDEYSQMPRTERIMNAARHLNRTTRTVLRVESQLIDAVADNVVILIKNGYSAEGTG